MSVWGRIRDFLDRSREKHKLSFTHDATYHEKWSFKLSMMNLYTLLGLYTIFVIVGLSLLYKFTFLKEMFIDVPTNASVEQVNDNTNRIDSLSSQVKSRQLYLNDLKKILLDQPFDDSLEAVANDTLLVNYPAHFNKSEQDSLLRDKIENEGKAAADINYDFFSAPVHGTVSQSYNSGKSHYGVDVVTLREAPIKTCLEGTVIFSSWTPNDGQVIIIQHSGDYLSVYKHCSSLLKKVGDNVQTGDPIGIVGDTGEHSSGPHLHFEIWKRGKSLNPQEFINFQN